MLVANFFDALQTSTSLDVETKGVRQCLFQLFSFYTIDTEAREFQTSGAINSEVLDKLPDRILGLMESIRPHAIRLVDSFALPDFLLDRYVLRRALSYQADKCSAMGRYDGRVYEDLFHRAHDLNPLNKVTFNPDYRSNEIVMNGTKVDSILAKL